VARSCSGVLKTHPIHSDSPLSLKRCNVSTASFILRSLPILSAGFLSLPSVNGFLSDASQQSKHLVMKLAYGLRRVSPPSVADSLPSYQFCSPSCKKLTLSRVVTAAMHLPIQITAFPIQTIAHVSKRPANFPLSLPQVERACPRCAAPSVELSRDLSSSPHSSQIFLFRLLHLCFQALPFANISR
jgi:endogenous inhibitor of DNA gyrase (YacG/DUF329 family)